MHHFAMVFGLFLVIIACISNSWIVVKADAPKLKSHLMGEVGLWNSCGVLDFNNQADIYGCKSTTDKSNYLARNLSNSDIYVLRTMSIITILVALTAVVLVFNPNYANNKIITMLMMAAALLSLVTLVYFHLRIGTTINITSFGNSSKYGFAFYSQILGSLLLILATGLHFRNHK